MALVKGTNCGFVTDAPVADPDGSLDATDGRSLAFQDTTSAGATTVTEIGWWCDNATEEANFEVGIYDHAAGPNDPGNLLAGEDRTNAKGTGAGWKIVVGLNITVSASTVYWIASQLDNTATQTNLNYTNDGGEEARLDLANTLEDPWQNLLDYNRLLAMYAVWEGAAPPAGIPILRRRRECA
jgi:hypothetical protein